MAVFLFIIVSIMINYMILCHKRKLLSSNEVNEIAY